MSDIIEDAKEITYIMIVLFGYEAAAAYYKIKKIGFAAWLKGG